ncbi:MAG: AEC family transporter [Granulosicoccus sp.]|nr:AEC family transporter [Granulosicoccus sp.]
MIAEILTVTAPVFCIVALGYFWARWRQAFDAQTLTNLVVKVATPCLVFTNLTQLNLGLDTIGQMAMAAACALLLAGGIGATVLALSNLPQHTYLASLMHPNTGNIGLPLALMAFGQEGLALAVAYFIVISISQYTIGYGIAAGSLSIKRFFQQPLLYAVILSLAVLGLSITVPLWIVKTTELMSGLVIPALLMVLGYSLAELKVSDIRFALYMAGVRLAIGIIVGLIVIKVLGLEGTPAGVVFLLSVMPIAVFNFVFAKLFNRSPEKVAGVIMTSTLLVFALLPVLVWVAIQIAERGQLR